MLGFAGAAEAEESVGFDPARVDYLLGEPPTWRFPTLMCIAAVALLGLLVTVATLVGREASGSATLAPPFLSAQPCIVMLAMVPCTIAALAVGIGRGQHEGDF